MKLLLSIFIALFVFAFAAPAQAASGRASQLATSALYPVALVTDDGLGSAIDVKDYDGSIAIILNVEAAGTGKTIDINVKEASTSGGSYSDVSGGAFTQVGNTASHQILFLDKAKLKRYLKLNIDVSATLSGSGKAVAASIVGFKKYR